MRSETTVVADKTPTGAPLTVRQALVALELGSADDVVLRYLDYLSAWLPVTNAYFLHVLPPFDLFNALYERERESLVSNFELNQEVIERMGDKIRQRMTKIDDRRIGFDVREGDPLEELLNAAEARKADLVVIGQKSGTEHHGILARNLARKAPCNALIVPQQAADRLETILIPIDFSPHSVAALRTALNIRRRIDHPVRIFCLNVYDLPNFSVYRIQKSREDLKRMLEDDRREAFRDFIDRYVPAGERDAVETELVERRHPGTANYLLDYASRRKVDLIVIGARGHSKVELLLLGSVTEKMLSANEQIPTLVVKA